MTSWNHVGLLWGSYSPRLLLIETPAETSSQPNWPAASCLGLSATKQIHGVLTLMTHDHTLWLRSSPKCNHTIPRLTKTRHMTEFSKILQDHLCQQTPTQSTTKPKSSIKLQGTSLDLDTEGICQICWGR